MKLELKHLALYLPYALGFIHQDEIYQLMQLNIKYDQKPMWIEGWNGKNLINVFPEGCQPILRPLSDLNRFGEDIINEHSINLLISEKYNLDYGTFSSFKGELDIELDGDPDLRYDVNKRISFDVMLTIQEELLKGHYDIYGLIENNLAIDINTVK